MLLCEYTNVLESFLTSTLADVCKYKSKNFDQILKSCSSPTTRRRINNRPRVLKQVPLVNDHIQCTKNINIPSLGRNPNKQNPH